MRPPQVSEPQPRRVSRVLTGAGSVLAVVFAILVGTSVVETRRVAESLELVRTELRPRAEAAYEIEINLFEVSNQALGFLSDRDTARLRLFDAERQELHSAVQSYVAARRNPQRDAPRDLSLQRTMARFDSASVQVVAFAASQGRGSRRNADDERTVREAYRARLAETASYFNREIQPTAIQEWHAEANRILAVSQRQRQIHVYVALVGALVAALAAVLASRAHRSVDDARARAELASQQKSEFASITAHELRSPLNAILGSLQLLATGRLAQLTPDAERYLEMAKRNSVRLMTLIDELLELDKLEAGMLPLAREPVDLCEVARSASVSLEAMAEAGGTTLRVESAQCATVIGDATRLRQVVINLISNAIKHAPRGTSVETSVRDGRGVVNVSVRDHGAGIAAADVERIFQRFVQAGPAKQHSTGLGLAIAREIVHRHNGRIGVNSEPGQGATFWFEIPIAS